MIQELIPFHYEFEKGFALWEIDEGSYWLYFRQVFDHRLVLSVDMMSNEIERKENKNYSQEELNAIKEFLDQISIDYDMGEFLK